MRLSVVDSPSAMDVFSAVGSVVDPWIVGDKSVNLLSSPTVPETKVVLAKPGQLSLLSALSLFESSGEFFPLARMEGMRKGVFDSSSERRRPLLPPPDLDGNCSKS